MPKPARFKLPEQARDQFSQLLRAPLPDVWVLPSSPWCQQLDAHALAFGNEIHLSSTLAGLGTEAFSAMFCHELAHVAQQHRGSVLPERELFGIPLSDSKRLEDDANAAHLGGLPSAMQSGPPRRVVQRLIAHEGSLVNSISTLPPQVQSVLGLIQGATEWLTEAIESSTDTYNFAGDFDLVERVQRGLHGSSLVLLRGVGVRVSPARLLQISQEDLTVLSQYEAAPGDGVVSTLQAKKLLSKNHLVGADELQVAKSFLDEVEAQDDPIFQGATLRDSIDLFGLVDSSQTAANLNAKSQKEATLFAIQAAQSPAQFLQLYAFYMRFLETKPSQRSADKRILKAQSVYDELARAASGFLRCPSVTHAPSPSELRQVFQSWTASGAPAGFESVPSGAAHLYDFMLRNSLSIEETPGAFTKESTKLLRDSEPSEIELTQDGNSQRYIYAESAAAAQVEWLRTGEVVLRRYFSDPPSNRPTKKGSK